MTSTNDKALSHLRTPSVEPWSKRDHGSDGDHDGRDPFDRDRDRILFSESFRRLQHKTQVFIVTESDHFSTRIHHSMETAQVGRSLAAMLGLNEGLAEAICLGHDVGHTPFGHAGEQTLNELLGGGGAWNSNAHSLRVLEDLEEQYFGFYGLDLTWATREGIARHMTRYDEPSTDPHIQEVYGMHPSPSPEAQVANLADEIAYLSHDVHDGLEYGLLTIEDLEEMGGRLNLTLLAQVAIEQKVAEDKGLPGAASERVRDRQLHRFIIDALLQDAVTASTAAGKTVASLDECRAMHEAVIRFSDEMKADREKLAKFLFGRMYKSPLVARQNAKAVGILTAVFNAVSSDYLLLPIPERERVDGAIAHAGLVVPDVNKCLKGSAGKDRVFVTEVMKRETAYFLAGLTDRGAIDLYSELFAPTDRAMGHHVQ